MSQDTTTRTAKALTNNERLALSREQMRQYLLGTSPAPTGASASPNAKSDPLRWMVTVRAIGAAANVVLRPVAEQHPLRLAGAAVLAGGLLAWARPWRWLLRPAVFAGIAAQITSRVISRVPVERLADTAIAMFATPPQRGR